jgi:UDP-N-acetylmuramoyl-tripeptide--D-alanyl-D-alanine ligase
VTDICIDSRKIKEGDLFVPIVGEKTDAHIYIPQTMQVGAATLTQQDISEFEPGRAYIRVSKTEQALKAIGRYVRSLYPNKIIGVTGSVGKTTTREMITAALSGNCRVYHTEGNLNSQIGVPITLSRMNDQPSDLAVLEMGISEEGHMDSLTDMVKPDIAVVTMIGVAHIEFMKTQENIRREKLKIAARMGENGVLFLNGDDPLLADMRGKNQVKTFYYGTADWCDYRAENIRLEQGMNVYEYVHGATRQTVRLSALGRHNVLNSLVGLAINDYLGLDLERAAEGFAEFTGLRQKVITASKGYTIIDDTYNASPDSMKASIGVLCDLNSAGRKIAVLGDMFELGENSSQYHQEVGRYLAQREIDELVTVGELSLDIAKGAKADEKLLIHSFPDTQSAAAYLKQILKSQDVVLLKASNGMKLGRIAESIC